MGPGERTGWVYTRRWVHNYTGEKGVVIWDQLGCLDESIYTHGNTGIGSIIIQVRRAWLYGTRMPR